MVVSFDYNNLHFGYCSSGALEYGLMLTLAVATICFVLTKVTHEYSWVDRLWSLLPPLYGSHFLFHQKVCRGEEVAQRQWMMVILAWIWGLRLTYNFWRKGGYAKGGEDYRWAYLRKNWNPIVMQLLNFAFTAYGQLIIIYLFSIPIYYSGQGDLNFKDVALLNLFMVFLTIETVADNQQWQFQTEKYRQIASKSLKHPFNIGFITTGLFRFSRHPNFFAEMGIWWTYYLFSVSSIGLNNSCIGVILLTLLFQGSTNLTEQISSEKYPTYGEYQKTTSRLWPMPPGPKLVLKQQ